MIKVTRRLWMEVATCCWRTEGPQGRDQQGCRSPENSGTPLGKCRAPAGLEHTGVAAAGQQRPAGTDASVEQRHSDMHTMDWNDNNAYVGFCVPTVTHTSTG